MDPSPDMDAYLRAQIRSAFDMFDKERKGCVIQECVARPGHANLMPSR